MIVPFSLFAQSTGLRRPGSLSETDLPMAAIADRGSRRPAAGRPRLSGPI